VSANGPQRRDQHKHEGPQVTPRRYEQLNPVERGSAPFDAPAAPKLLPRMSMAGSRIPPSGTSPSCADGMRQHVVAVTSEMAGNAVSFAEWPDAASRLWAVGPSSGKLARGRTD
jgi:hypothetical protein